MSLSIFETLKGATPEERLVELGIELPAKREPVGNYTGAVSPLCQYDVLHLFLRDQ